MPCYQEKARQACYTLTLGSILIALAMLNLKQRPDNCDSSNNDATLTYCSSQTAVSIGLVVLATCCCLAACVTTNNSNTSANNNSILYNKLPEIKSDIEQGEHTVDNTILY